MHNLARYVGGLGHEAAVHRNDALSLDEIERLAPSHIIISPGPCTPAEAGVSTAIVRRFGEETPILGVCLGHQCIGALYGGSVVRAPEIMHGKTSAIHHSGVGVFAGLPDPFEATRYHSLVVDEHAVPDVLELTAWTESGTVMGLRHRELPIEGVQFHPESILTAYGSAIIASFVAAARRQVR